MGFRARLLTLKKKGDKQILSMGNKYKAKLSKISISVL